MKKKSVVAEPKWQVIDDKKVRHAWSCPECGETCYVDPTFYQDNGTPMCIECDVDMLYVHTEIQ